MQREQWCRYILLAVCRQTGHGNTFTSYRGSRSAIAAAMASTTNATPTPTHDAPKPIKKANSKPTPAPVQTVFGCAHIKNLLSSARPQATEGYTKLIGTLQKEGSLADRIYKSAGGPAACGHVTYLCLQCPNVSSSREKHNPNHKFCWYHQVGSVAISADGQF